ncbi:MAG: hypothetical protein ABGZ35_08020, partial [Planctomycetaceae bacterium]
MAKPSSRVFLPPTRPSTAEQEETDDEEDEEVGDIPDNLEDALKILDPSSIGVRKDGTRKLTDIASRLEEEALVRTPRLDILINDAIGPLMQSLTSDEDSRGSGGSLLVQAVNWIWRLSDEGRDRLRKDALRVPVPSDSEWVWVAPSSVYFAKGWVDDDTDALLETAYGFDPLKRIVPWDVFVEETGADPGDREAWIGALESLGVSATPKIKRRASRVRTAPLVCWSTEELQIVEGVSCPIAVAQPYWQAYLETTRKRSTQTQSGQKFDFRTVTWIEGLERDESRESIVELMLARPSQYEAELSTSLERHQRRNQDRSPVVSLWVHAIVTNQWAVVPTQNGRVSPQSAWVLDDDQRKLAKQRLRLLNQIDERFARGKSLLSAFGITSVSNASVERLLSAIDALAEHLGDLNADDQRNAKSLADDLFKYLQLAYGESPGPLDQLADLTLPLFKRQAIVGVAGAAVEMVYFNDDPTRAAFIPDFADSFVWPLQPRYAYRDLVAEIRKQLGDEAVLFTSRVNIDSGFVPDEAENVVLLLDWITERWPNDNVISDLVCLIAYSGRETNPGGDEFRRTWNRFKKAQLCRGRFPQDSPKSYFYDQQTSQLQVGNELSDFDVVEATWMIVDQSYRDTWAAYARDLFRERVTEFMAERSITTTHRENVEAEIGLTSAARFQHMKSAFYSVWRKQFGDQPVELFESEWKGVAGVVRRLCEWVKSPALEEVVAAALMQTEEEASIAILESAGITVASWQADRERLNDGKLAFSDTSRAYKAVLRQLVGILKVVAARSVRANLSDAQSLIDVVKNCTIPSQIEFVPAKDVKVNPAVVATANVALREQDDSDTRKVLLDRLATIEKNAGDFKSLSDVPRRDVAAYVDDEEPKRTRDAKARLEDITQVCSALAPHVGEVFNAAVLASDNRVESLTSGWWANFYSVVPAIQSVLQKHFPMTSKRLSDARVFRDLAPRNVLLSRFDELKDQPPQEKEKVERKIELFGSQEDESKVTGDLTLGSTGEIGKRLRDAMKSQTPTANASERAKVQVPTSKGGGGGGQSGPDGEENRHQRQLTGRLGEACFYEWGLLHLPEFDERA